MGPASDALCGYSAAPTPHAAGGAMSKSRIQESSQWTIIHRAQWNVMRCEVEALAESRTASQYLADIDGCPRIKPTRTVTAGKSPYGAVFAQASLPCTCTASGMGNSLICQNQATARRPQGGEGCVQTHDDKFERPTDDCKPGLRVKHRRK